MKHSVTSLDDLNKRVLAERKAGTLTRSKAVYLNCLDCMGYQPREVTRCPRKSCPLWEFRNREASAASLTERTAKSKTVKKA